MQLSKIVHARHNLRALPGSTQTHPIHAVPSCNHTHPIQALLCSMRTHLIQAGMLGLVTARLFCFSLLCDKIKFATENQQHLNAWKCCSGPAFQEVQDWPPSTQLIQAQDITTIVMTANSTFLVVMTFAQQQHSQFTPHKLSPKLSPNIC